MYVPTLEEIIMTVKFITEDFVDTCKECGDIIQDFCEDVERDIQQDIIEKSAYLGLDEHVRKHYEKKNRRKRKRRNMRHTLRNFLLSAPGESVSSIDELRKGDHICMYSFGNMFTHHGIYCDKGGIIHYAPDGSGVVSIRYDSILYEVMNGEVRLLKDSESFRKYPRIEVLSRAYSRLGEKEYDIFTNNCEHFARWCRCGRNDEP